MFPDSVRVDFGSLANGSALKGLYAVDGNPYSIATATESGSNNQVGAFLGTFPIPAGTVSAVTHVTTSVSAAGCVLQGYVYKADGTVEYLGFRPLPSGTSVQEFPITGDQLLRFRDAAGETRIQFRVFRPPSAGSGQVGWSVDAASVLLPILPENGGADTYGINQFGLDPSTLYAVDGAFHTLTTIKESGTNNQLAAFACPFRIPAGTPSATLHAVLDTSLDRTVLQGYVFNSSNADFLDYRTITSGEGAYDLPITGTQIAQYRDASSGQTLLHLRVYRPPLSSGDTNTSQVTWRTNQFVVYAAPSNGPAFPTGLTASPDANGGIDLAWTDNANNETGYVVERKGGADADFVQVGTASADATVYHDSGLSASTAYTYRVKATNSDGDSPYSNEASATTQSLTPTGPAFLKRITLSRQHSLVAGAYQGSVLLNAPAATATTVSVQSSDSAVSVPSSVVVPAGASSSSFSYTINATTGDPRYVVVVAKNGIWAQRTYVNIVNQNQAFSGFKVVPGKQQVLVSWNPFPDYVYQDVSVKRRKIDPTTNAVVDTQTIQTSGSAYLDTDVSSSFKYSYQVEALAQGNEPSIAPTAWNEATPSASGSDLSLLGSPAMDGEVWTARTAQTQSTSDVFVFVDGKVVHKATQSADNTITAQLRLWYLPLGSHDVRVVADFGTTFASTPIVSIGNTGEVRQWSLDPSMVAENGDLVGLSATVTPGTAWSVRVADPDTGNEIRSWSGTSFDGRVDLAWDGNLADLNTPSDDGQKQIEIMIDGKKFPRRSDKSDKNPTFLLLVNKEQNDLPNRDSEYSSFLNNLLVKNHPASASFIAKVMYSTDNMDAGGKTQSDIVSWMRSHLDSFYISAHGRTSNFGNNGYPVTKWGNLTFYSYPFNPTGNPNQISVPNVVGSRRYRFVWMDDCFSAGGNYNAADLNTSFDDIGSPNLAWAQAFNVRPDLYNDVLFVGWNGFAGTNYGNPTVWFNWRKTWWGSMAANNNAQDAFAAADRGFPYSNPVPYKPYDFKGQTPRRTYHGAPYYFHLF